MISLAASLHFIPTLLFLNSNSSIKVLGEETEDMPLINSKQTQSDGAVSTSQIHSNQVLFFPDGIFTSLKSTC